MVKVAMTSLSKPAPYRNRAKVVGILLWIALFGVYAAYLWRNNVTASQALDQIVALLETAWGPILYIVIYSLSPLVFFSAAVLAITGGCIFGAGSLANLALAILYTTIGSLGAAQVAYWMGRLFGAELLPAHEGVVARYADRMRQNSFMTVLIMHLIFLPYELVNYLAGVLRIRPVPFLLATFLGSLPGLFTFVPFGAALDMKKMIAGEQPDFSWSMLLFSAIVLGISLLIAYFVRRSDPKSLSV